MTRRFLSLFKTDIGKLLSGNIVVQFSTLLQAVFVSRALGPEGKGEFIEIILWPTIISGFSILGLYTGIAKISAKNAIFSRFNIARPTLKATLIVGGFGTIFSCLVAPLLVSTEQNHLTKLVLVFSSFVLINNVARGFNAIDHGRKDFVKYSITRSILNPIFFLFLFILFLLNDLNLATVILSLLIANLSVCLIRTIYTLRSQKEKKNDFPLKKLFNYSLKFSISDLSEPIYAYFDKAILTLVLASYDLGIYTTAYSAASLVNIVSNVYGTKLFSELAGGTPKDFINSFVRQNLVLMFLLSIILFIVFPFLIPFVFGADFTPAILPAILLMVTCILQGLSYVIERGILAMGYPYAGAKAKVVFMIMLSVLAFVSKMTGILNINIMILIVTLCQSVYLVYLLLQLKKLCGVNVDLVLKKYDFEVIFRRIFK